MAKTNFSDDFKRDAMPLRFLLLHRSRCNHHLMALIDES